MQQLIAKRFTRRAREQGFADGRSIKFRQKIALLHGVRKRRSAMLCSNNGEGLVHVVLRNRSVSLPSAKATCYYPDGSAKAYVTCNSIIGSESTWISTCWDSKALCTT